SSFLGKLSGHLSRQSSTPKCITTNEAKEPVFSIRTSPTSWADGSRDAEIVFNSMMRSQLMGSKDHLLCSGCFSPRYAKSIGKAFPLSMLAIRPSTEQPPCHPNPA